MNFSGNDYSELSHILTTFPSHYFHIISTLFSVGDGGHSKDKKIAF